MRKPHNGALGIRPAANKVCYKINPGTLDFVCLGHIYITTIDGYVNSIAASHNSTRVYDEENGPSSTLLT